MALHLEQAYSVERQTLELTDRDMTTLLVEEGGDAIAYAQIRSGSHSGMRHESGAIQVWRFCVDRGWHGRGVA